MKKYSLFPSGVGFCFGNEKKGTRNESFYSKKQAIIVLRDMLFADSISVDNALTLLEEIINLPYFPITERKTGNTDHLSEDIDSLIEIKMTRHVFQTIQKIGKCEGPAVILCPSCGKHANIIGPNFISQPFGSKAVGKQIVEFLWDNSKISYAEYLHLKKDVESINFPESIINPKEN